MKKLTEAQIIKIMREEWNARIEKLCEDVDLSVQTNIDGSEKEVISPGFKVRNVVKKSKAPEKGNPRTKSAGKSTSEKKGDSKGFLYTVISVNSNRITLRPPDGPEDGSKDFFVDEETLEKDYVRD